LKCVAGFPTHVSASDGPISLAIGHLLCIFESTTIDPLDLPVMSAKEIARTKRAVNVAVGIEHIGDAFAVLPLDVPYPEGGGFESLQRFGLMRRPGIRTGERGCEDQQKQPASRPGRHC